MLSLIIFNILLAGNNKFQSMLSQPGMKSRVKGEAAIDNQRSKEYQ